MQKKLVIAYISLLLAISGLMYTNGAVLPDQRDAWINEAGNGVNAETIETRLIGTTSDAIVAAGDPITTPNDEIVTTSDPIEMTSESIVTAAGTTGFANDTYPPQTFEEWRNFLLTWNNMTLDDLENADPVTIQTLDQEAHIYEGWVNGTYTDEQKSQLLAELHQTPYIQNLVCSSTTDGNFEYSFDVLIVNMGEHTFRVYAYIVYEMCVMPIGVFWDLSHEKVYGPYQYFPINDPYPYNTLPYLPELDPSTTFIVSGGLIGSFFGHEQLGLHKYQGSKGGLEIGNPRLVVMILYKWDEADDWTFTYMAHFRYAAAVFDVTIYDDDITPPVIEDIVISPVADSQEFFLVGAKATDASGIEPVIGFNLGIFPSWYYVGYYWAFVPSPRIPGIHLAVVTVWDADYDREGDRLFAFWLCSYSVFDDDVNPPEVSWSTTDIRWSGDLIQLSFTVDATDARGIGSSLIQIEGYIFTSLGPHTVTLPPGLYTAYISVTDDDNDWSGDNMTTVLEEPIVLDLSPPTTELILTPYFIDETGCYVTSATEYTLRATDDVTGVAQTYYRINGGDWIPYTTGFKLSGPEGTHTISYYSIDNNGNVEPFKTQTVVIDNTAPITSLTPSGVHGLGDWFISDVLVTLSPTDGSSGAAQTLYSYDRSNWVTYHEPFSVGREGSITLYYYSIDNLGNTEDVKTDVVNIDWTAPETTISPSGTEGLGDWYISDVTVTLSATDITSGVARIMYSFDGITWFTYYCAIYSTTLTAEVQYDHYYVGETIILDGDLKDWMGSAVSGETINIYVKTGEFADWTYLTSCTTAENGHWLSSFTTPVPPPVAWFKAEFAGTAAYEASSAETNYICIDLYEPPPPIIIIGSLNTATTASLSSTSATTVFDPPGPFTITDEGVTTVYYYSVDVAGNHGDQETATTKIDKTAPETTASLGGTMGLGDWYVSDLTVSLAAVDDASGVATTAYRINGGAWITCTQPFVLTTDGIFVVEYNSTDCAGNIEATNSLTMKIDKAPPVTTTELSGTLGLEGWYVSGVTVTLTATDDYSGVRETQYSFNGIDWSNYTGTFTITSEGDTTVYFRSIDNAGNIEDAKSLLLSIDTVPPTTNLVFSPQWTDGAGKIYVTSATSFVLTASDPMQGSGLYGTYYAINGEQKQYSGAFNLLGPDGAYTISYWSNDTAGNVEDVKTVTVNLVSCKIDSYITRRWCHRITDFDAFFIKRGHNGYKLLATRPCEFYYRIDITNNLPIAITTLRIGINLPPEFMTGGMRPIHVYLGCHDITRFCSIQGTTVSLQGIAIPPGRTVSIIVHIDYKLKGTTGWSPEKFGTPTYTFSVTVCDGLGTYSSSANLVAHAKYPCICVHDKLLER